MDLSYQAEENLNEKNGGKLKIMILIFITFFLIIAAIFTYKTYSKEFVFEINNLICDDERSVFIIEANKNTEALVSINMSENKYTGFQEKYVYENYIFKKGKKEFILLKHDAYRGNIDHEICVDAKCIQKSCSIGDHRKADCLALTNSKIGCEADPNCAYNDGLCLFSECANFIEQECEESGKCRWDISTESCSMMEEKVFDFEVAGLECSDEKIIFVARTSDYIIATATIQMTEETFSNYDKKYYFPDHIFKTGKNETFQFEHMLRAGDLDLLVCIGEKCLNEKCRIGDDRRVKCLSLTDNRNACFADQNCVYENNVCRLLECGLFSLSECGSVEKCMWDKTINSCRERECYDFASYEGCISPSEKECAWFRGLCVPANDKDYLASFSSKTARTQNTNCTDTDYGLDIFTKGTITGVHRCIYDGLTQDCRGGPVTLDDKCIQSIYSVEEHGIKPAVDELYCGNDGRITGQAFLCPNGCHDGACISEDFAIEALNIRHNENDFFIDIKANRRFVIHPGYEIRIYLSDSRNGDQIKLIKAYQKNFTVYEGKLRHLLSNKYSGQPEAGDDTYSLKIPFREIDFGSDMIYYWLTWEDKTINSEKKRGAYSLILQ